MQQNESKTRTTQEKVANAPGKSKVESERGIEGGEWSEAPAL